MRLWSSDGTPAGTQPLSDQPFADMALALTPVGDRLFFITDDGVHGRELWVSDGTPAGTRMVVDIAPGGSADEPASGICGDSSFEGVRMYAYGERLVFAADDGVHGCEPWLSDGTAAGTRMIADLNPGSAGSLNWPTEWFSTRAVVILGEQLIFPATDGVHGTELWISDGSAKGTRLLQDIAPGAATSAPDELAVLNGRLFFSADDGDHGREPWVSDGSTEGTRMIGDIAPGSHGSDAAEWAWLGSRLYFTADDGTHGKEVWTVTMSTR
jgi:ELWxxDGT repeat protein